MNYSKLSRFKKKKKNTGALVTAILSLLIAAIIVIGSLIARVGEEDKGDCPPPPSASQSSPREDISDILDQLPPCETSLGLLDVTPAQLQRLAQEIVEATNDHRESLGLSVLTVDEAVAAAAQGHSDFVVDDKECWPEKAGGTGNNSTAHRCKDELSIDHRIFEAGYRGDCVGAYRWHTRENVMWYGGWRRLPTGESAVEVWLDSPGHKDAIEDPENRVTGIGIAWRPDGSIVVTQNFGG